MNVELLRKIAAVIQEKPHEFGMPSFCRVSECGTTRCIGGWVDEIAGCGTSNRESVLGLSWAEAHRLFYADKWPEQFQGKEPFPKGSPFYAEIAEEACWNPTIEQAVARIEHFIATEGRE